MDTSWTSVVKSWIILTFYISGSSSVGTHNIYSNGCSKERINLECPDFHKIAIKRLFYGAKNDTQCANNGRKHSKDCCLPTHNDCLVVEDKKYPFLNMLCSGQRGCDIEANSISSGMSCRLRRYGEMTDYMSVIHDCIPDDDISFLCSNSYKRGRLLYLSNNNYPQPISAGNRQCQCLIKTKNHVGIDIHALDIIITRSESGKQCYQDIELRDDDGHRKEITCGHPGLYAFRNIYNNDVRSVTLTLNNRAPKSQGYVWIQAKAKDDKDYLEIFCGDEMKRHLGYPVDDAESRTIDDKKNKENNDPVPDQDWGNGQFNATGESTPHVVSDMVALIVGVAVALALIIIIGLIGIIILCVRRSQQNKRPTRNEPPPFPSPMLKSKEDNHSSNTYCRYDYDEDKYCSIKRSPMRMTKFSNMEADLKLKEAFAQGMQSSEDVSPNGYINYTEELTEFSSNQKKPLLTNKDEVDGDSDESEVIMPKSEFIAIGKAIQPRSVQKDVNSTLPEKKKNKNKTVTFSPVAMVTPLPSGSEESVPDDMQSEELKCNIMDMYSKTLPTRYLSSPEKSKKVILVPGTQDDMCLSSFQSSAGCENVTEEDLWKAFHIKLDDSCNELEADPIAIEKLKAKQEQQRFLEQQQQKTMEVEDPDYDENPYDNLPYINVGSLRRKNAPPPPVPYKDPSIKRNFLSQKPTIESIPETC